MGEVESMMQASVRFALTNSVADYAVKERTQWVKDHPG